MELVRAFTTQSATTKGFFVQYVSLILIILTVLSGVLTRPSEQPRQSIEQLATLPAVSEWRAWPSVAELASEAQLKELLAAHQSILNAHDVALEIEISASALDEGLHAKQEIEDVLQVPYDRRDALRTSLVVGAEYPALAIRERWYRLTTYNHYVIEGGE